MPDAITIEAAGREVRASATRRGRAHFRRQRGEPKRVQPSRRKKGS